MTSAGGVAILRPETTPEWWSEQEDAAAGALRALRGTRGNSKVTSRVTRAVSVEASTAPVLGARPGASPRAALHQLFVGHVPFRVAKELLVRGHYLRSMPGGTRLSFGIFVGRRLTGALTLGVGPKLGHRLVEAARAEDCVTLTRLWLSDEMPSNSESRVIGVVLRALKRHTCLKFVLAYADPSVGHVGTIYQATGWLYTGLSAPMSMYDLGDGVLRHSRSLGYSFGSHSKRHFEASGVPIRSVTQSPKHRYIRFLDPCWQRRLRVPVLPYPKQEDASEGR